MGRAAAPTTSPDLELFRPQDPVDRRERARGFHRRRKVSTIPGARPDHAFFDDVTTFAKDSLCIDTTRVFVTGMSMGGMYTYSLSTDRQKSFRAGVGLAPTNFLIWLPNPKLHGSDRLDADDRHERHYLRLGRREARSRGRNTSPSRKPPTTGARFRRRFPLGRRVITSVTTSPDASPGIPSKPAHSTAVTSTAIATPART